ncbi:carcinoembryonic antigen-related cell adhesion molecule 3-like [Chionomys nivalis]|uniref:carcinoembryonic antigen-related cell adhesion molecule 3-like n=1 Tax=Chionomys nivalis TaxID=269649 RepID=UPI00259634BD|nr:carcinoembryonic antigen-related cell adhesion molecule 3-like [Chionomys nivalis]
MEVSSVTPYKGCTPWQGLLLTAFLLICCHSPATAEVTIESVPPNVFEGDSVLLYVHSLPENLLAFAWFKGLTNMKRRIVLYELNNNLSLPGPEYSGRETVYGNGSLWISNVTHVDSGFYTLRTISRHSRVVSLTTIHLPVYTSSFTCGHLPTLAQLTIESVPPSVAEGASVLLHVHNLPENLQTFSWYKGVITFNNLEVARHIIATNSTMPGPAHSGRETVYSNGSLLLHNVTWKDTGFYTLRTLSRDLKIELVHVQLHVDSSLSTCCNPLSFAQLTIEPVPRNAAEGETVLFLVHNLPEDVRAFSWYRGVYSIQIFKIAEYSRATNSVTRGPVHSRRETVYPNGSLQLRDVTENDSGLYTLQILNRDLKAETAHVQFHVNSK